MSRGLTIGSRFEPELKAADERLWKLGGFVNAPDTAAALEALRASSFDLAVLAGPPPASLVRRALDLGGLPLLCLGWDPDLSAPVPDFVIAAGPCEGALPGPLARAVAARIRDRRFVTRLKELSKSTQGTPGPFTHRAGIAVRGLKDWLGVEEVALYLAETSGRRVFPLLAADPEDAPVPGEIVEGDASYLPAFSSGVPTRVQDRLVIPLEFESRPWGLLLIKGEPDDPAWTIPIPRVDLAAHHLAHLLLATHLRELWEGQVAAERNIDAYRLFQVEKLASLGQLAAGIAHEINNPLFVITGNLEMALDLVEDTPRNLLNKAIKAADRIKKIIFDMRQFFLPTARRELVQAIRLNDLVESSIKIVSLQPNMKNIAFVKELDPDLPPVIGDDNQILQVFTNLFLNAAQATPGSGTIRVNTTRRQGFVIIQVSDTGVGIAHENLPRIFDPFFTTKQDWMGTGLGLSVTYTIIKNHSGTIGVTSEVGKGTTFEIKLPASAAEPEVPAPEPAVEGLPPALNKGRVLVVDDEENVREYLEYLLSENGYEVDSAPSGVAAIKMMEQYAYPVVILDHIMPGLNGLETFQRLIEINPGSRIILLTGALEMHAEGIQREGFFRVLTKPCSGDQVVQVVSKGLDRAGTGSAR